MNWTADRFEAAECCLFCKSTQSTLAVTDVEDYYFRTVTGKFDYRRCAVCQSLYLTRRPRAEHLAAAYSSYYTHSSSDDAVAPPEKLGVVKRAAKRIATGYLRVRYGGSPGILDRLFASIYRLFRRKRLEVDVQHRFLPPTPVKILDYGCGNGNFLKLASRYGHQVIGLDFDEQALTAVRNQGIEAHNPEYFAARSGASEFGAITLAHVLEHVDRPAALLADINKMMHLGGHLFVEVPNAQAAGLAIFGKYWRGLEAPRHFSIPSEQGLRSALEQAGFGEIVFHPRASVRSWLFAQSAGSAPHSEQAGLHNAAANFADSKPTETTEFLTVTAAKVRNLC